MGRGSSGQRKLAEEQLNRTNTFTDALIKERGPARGAIQAEGERLLGDTGYSPEEQAAIQEETMGSATTATDVMRDRAARRVARSRNTAGYAEAESEAGRDEARTKAELTR